MLQRIQTVYLSFALIVLSLMVWMPFGEIVVADQIYLFSIKGIVNQATGESLQSGIPLMAFLGISMGLQIGIIFGYKNRIRQMRMATYNFILMLGIVGVCFYFKYASFKDVEVVVNNYNLALVFPFVAAILNYLAIRAIGRDEALVKSIDRIR